MNVDGLLQAHHQSLRWQWQTKQHIWQHKPEATTLRVTAVDRSTYCSHLSVEPDGEDVVGVAVVTNLCTFLEVVDVHPPRHGQTDHHHQTAGEQALHYIHVCTLHWEGQKRDLGYRLHDSTYKSNGSFGVSSYQQCMYSIFIKANTASSCVVSSYTISCSWVTNDNTSTAFRDTVSPQTKTTLLSSDFKL